ncbi:MAG: DUF1922 domain-containing protein [Candidatus Bathyarchaeia archaeon]|nr:DUF1922 domain-containing protein [Candidatus Bathyarchaeota archaeon]
MYVAVHCPRCGRLMLAKAVQRTRSCPHCGYRARIGELRILGRAETPERAVALIRMLKMKEAGRRGEPTR